MGHDPWGHARTTGFQTAKGTYMCVMCDGATLDDLVEDLRHEIATLGFAIVTVCDDGDDRGDAYTIGLIEGWDHPELMIRGYQLSTAQGILREFGHLVACDLRLEGRPTVGYDGAELGVVPIDQVHLDGDLMAAWHWCYGTNPERELRALQVVLPDDGFCYVHQKSQLLLGTLGHRDPSRRHRPPRRRGARRTYRKPGGR